MSYAYLIRFPQIRSLLEGERVYFVEGLGAQCSEAKCSNAPAYRTVHQLHRGNRPPSHVRKLVCKVCAERWCTFVNCRTAQQRPDLDIKVGVPPLAWDEAQRELFEEPSS